MLDRSVLRLMKSGRPAAIPTAAESRDLTAVIVFSSIGLVMALCFSLLFPDGFSALIAQMP